MSSRLNRRNLLRAMSTTAAASGLSLVGTGAAGGPTRPEAIAEYGDRETMAEKFERHGGQVLEELADRSILESASPDALPLQKFDEGTTGLEPDSEDVSGITVVSESDGPNQPLLMAAKNTADHTVRVFVKPETDESYAFVRPKGDDPSFVIKPSMEPTVLRQVTTEDHCDDQDDVICGTRCQENKYNCTLTCSKLYYAQYLEWYKCGSTFHDCCSEVTKTVCGDCYETCAGYPAC